MSPRVVSLFCPLLLHSTTEVQCFLYLLLLLVLLHPACLTDEAAPVCFPLGLSTPIVLHLSLLLCTAGLCGPDVPLNVPAPASSAKYWTIHLLANGKKKSGHGTAEQ